MDEVLEAKNYIVEALSPVHIGSGEKASDADYIFHDGKLFIINVEKFIEAITPQQYDLFSKVLLQTGSMQRCFQALNVSPNEYGKYAEYSVECRAKPMELQTFVKNANLTPYIPGSSIKGALRTAILYNLLISSQESFQLLKKRIYSVISRRDAEKLMRNIVESLLGGEGGSHSPHYDSMKFIRISDSSGIPIGGLTVQGLCLIETSGPTSHRKTGRVTYVEAIKPGTTACGKITVDKTIMMWEYGGYAVKFPALNTILNLNVVASYANKFASDLIDYEEKFAATYGLNGLKQFYAHLKREVLRDLSDGQFLLRVGWGSGYLATTIGLILQRDSALFRDLRKRFNLGIQRIPVFPISRKVILADDQMTPLGWVKITVADR
jgi:CRISPR-associated protein Csm5